MAVLGSVMSTHQVREGGICAELYQSVDEGRVSLLRRHHHRRGAILSGGGGGGQVKLGHAVMGRVRADTKPWTRYFRKA